MKSYDELKALIERRGVHPEFGDAGEGWGIEQNPHELATFLVRMQELGVQSVLEIGTGYKGGLSRFLAADMGWQVTTVDVQDYGHAFEGVTYIVIELGTPPDEIFPNGLPVFDLIFIDGAHDFISASDDYFTWGEYANKAIALHDIAGLRDCEGVAKFWHDLHEANYAEGLVVGQIIDETAQKSGIGWVETDDTTD